jgi:hypothetical protein
MGFAFDGFKVVGDLLPESGAWPIWTTPVSESAVVLELNSFEAAAH